MGIFKEERIINIFVGELRKIFVMQEIVNKILEERDITIDLLTIDELEVLKKEIEIKESGGAILDGVLFNPELYYSRPIVKNVLAKYGLTINQFTTGELDELISKMKKNDSGYYIDMDGLLKRTKSPLSEKIEKLIQ